MKPSILTRDKKKASQGFVDFTTKTIPELEELIERQNKLLQNRMFLEKLPDKGKKIQSFKTELEIKLSEKKECNETCQLLGNLTLNDKNHEDIEWNKGKLNIQCQELDSDDDNDSEEAINSLKVVATHSGTARGKVTKIAPIKNGGKIPPYIDKVCEKYEKINQIKERFKPNQLRNNDKTLFIVSAKKVKERLGDKWEITQATPPAPVYKDLVMISLSDSLKLQKEHAKKLRKIEKKDATERLLQNMSIKMGEKLPVHNITEHRSSKNIFDVEHDENYESNQNESDGDQEKST